MVGFPCYGSCYFIPANQSQVWHKELQRTTNDTSIDAIGGYGFFVANNDFTNFSMSGLCCAVPNTVSPLAPW